MVRIAVRKTKKEAKKVADSKNRIRKSSSFASDKKYRYSIQKLKKGYGVYKNKR